MTVDLWACLCILYHCTVVRRAQGWFKKECCVWIGIL